MFKSRNSPHHKYDQCRISPQPRQPITAATPTPSHSTQTLASSRIQTRRPDIVTFQLGQWISGHDKVSFSFQSTEHQKKKIGEAVAVRIFHSILSSPFPQVFTFLSFLIFHISSFVDRWLTQDLFGANKPRYSLDLPSNNFVNFIKT